MNDLQKIIMILRDYEADQRDGYVSNLNQYIERRCYVLNAMKYKDDILMIISKTIKSYVCKVKEYDTKS